MWRKRLRAHTFFAKIVRFLTRIAQKVINTSGSYSLGQLIVLCPFSTVETDVFAAASENVSSQC